MVGGSTLVTLGYAWGGRDAGGGSLGGGGMSRTAGCSQRTSMGSLLAWMLLSLVGSCMGSDGGAQRSPNKATRITTNMRPGLSEPSVQVVSK